MGTIKVNHHFHKHLKYRNILIFMGASLLSLSGMANAAELCITAIDSSYAQYGQNGNFQVQVGKRKYTPPRQGLLRVTDIQPNRKTAVVILQDGRKIQSFYIQMTAKEKACLVKSPMYPTWMLWEQGGNCRC